MYRSYIVNMRTFPDSDWLLVFCGRIKTKTYIEYERRLNELRRILNKDSIYQFQVVSCYDQDEKKQMELPF